MKQGTGKVAEQSGQWGYYAEVKLEVAEDDGLLDVQVNWPREIGDRWRVAVAFGVRYAWEHVSPHTTAGLRVLIHEVHWQPGDSSDLVVAVAAMRATWDALGRAPKVPPIIDAPSGRLTLAK